MSQAEGISHVVDPNVAVHPLVTVLTVVYNAADQIGETIRSVRPFIGTDVEYVVIDGGSRDGTTDVLRAEADGITILVSEPDQGIYDAMNKGLNLARGRFILHLNVGDRLLDIPENLLHRQPDNVACVACCVQLSSGAIFYPVADWRMRLHNTLHHQGCFYARKGLPQYDLRYRIFADFDLNQRLLASGRRVVVADVCVASHDEGGVSHSRKHFREVYRIVFNNQGLFWLVVCWIYFKWKGVAKRLKSYVA